MKIVRRKPRFIVLEDRSGATFKVGETIPTSGVYRVLHANHRHAHEVTLLAGETFPRCTVCGTDVSFSLLQAAPTLDSNDGFRIRLYEIPHPQDTEDSNVSARSA